MDPPLAGLGFLIRDSRVAPGWPRITDNGPVRTQYLVLVRETGSVGGRRWTCLSGAAPDSYPGDWPHSFVRPNRGVPHIDCPELSRPELAIQRESTPQAILTPRHL